jgi:hypothetical protein
MIKAVNTVNRTVLSLTFHTTQPVQRTQNVEAVSANLFIIKLSNPLSSFRSLKMAASPSLYP